MRRSGVIGHYEKLQTRGGVCEDLSCEKSMCGRGRGVRARWMTRLVLGSLQNRRHFFAYFRRTEAKARRARRASHARGEERGGEEGKRGRGEERKSAFPLTRASL